MAILPHRGLLMGGRPFLLEYRSKADALPASDLLPIPADVQPGDLLIVVHVTGTGYNKATGVSPEPIAGFTELVTLNANTSTDVWIGYKIAAPGDAGSTISENFRVFGNYSDMAVILAFSTGKGAVAATANDTSITGSYTTLATTRPSTLGGTLPLIALGVLASASTLPPTFDVETPAFDGEVVADSGSGGTIRVGYSIYNEGDTLADHSISTSPSNYVYTIMTYIEVSDG